jgi:aminopeptidase
LLFYSTLFDENAACHIALGAGYVGCLPNGDGFKNDADRKAAGCNVSLVHEDVMIGSPDTEVTGIDQSGQETVLIKHGLFVV